MEDIDLTEDWQQVGQGPAYMETDNLADIHMGNVAPGAGIRAFIRLGGGRIPRVSTTAVLKRYSPESVLYT